MYGAMPNYYPLRCQLSPQQAEREQVRLVAQKLGFALLIMQAISFIMQIAAMSLPWMLKGTGAGILELLSDSASLWIMNVVITVPMFTVPFVLAAYMLDTKPGALVALKKVSPRLGAALVAVTLGVAMVGNMMSGMLSSVLDNVGLNPPMPEYDYPAGIFGKILSVLAISAVPALIEEFAFRGIFMGALRRFGDLFAIVVSSLFFGLMHGNMAQMPFAFIVGLALGLTVKITNSLWPAIIAHFLNNFFSVMLDMASESLTETESAILNDLYFIVIIVFAVIAAVLLIRKGKLSLQDDSYESKIFTKEKFSAFFRAPALIAATVLLIGAVILNTFALSWLEMIGFSF